MTERDKAEALDEAVLLMIRKLRRIYPGVWDDMISTRLPAGAQYALSQAEMRADRRRDQHGPLTEWPVEEDLDTA